VKIYVQILESSHISAIRSASVDVTLCINDLRMGIMAQSTLCPGFSTLIGNLVQSYAPPESGNDYSTPATFFS
jgi:hypothetical protein